MYTPTEWTHGLVIQHEALNNIESGVNMLVAGYEPTAWAKGDVVTSEKLNKIENGILTASEAETALEELSSTVVNYISGEATTFKIPEGTTKIRDYCFQLATNLQSVIVPDTVTEIGRGAFGACENITSVDIGKKIANINDRAFSGCSSLNSLTVRSRAATGQPPRLGTAALQNTAIAAGNGKIYVPADRINIYKNGWSLYADYIYPIPD